MNDGKIIIDKIIADAEEAVNKTIAEALREGKQRLRSAGKDAYAVEAELLLETFGLHILGRDEFKNAGSFRKAEAP